VFEVLHVGMCVECSDKHWVGICVECSDKHNEVGLYAEWSDKQFDG
jgi:hypothetical protein